MSKKGFFARRVTAMACTAALLASSIPLSWVQAIAYDNNPVKIPQFLMTATASSEESSSDTCYASLAIDGDSGTMWHTRWSTSASAPHWISVDLGRNVELTKLTYLPRQDGNSNGYIREYAISVSADGNTYTPIAEGSWESDMTEKEAVFSAPVSARYVRLEAVNASMASCAELNFFAAESVYAPLWDQLDNAYEAIGQAEAGEEIGQYPQEQIDLFQQAIDEAELQAASLPESDEAAIQAAADTLSAAMHAFEESRNMYGRDDLETCSGSPNPSWTARGPEPKTVKRPKRPKTPLQRLSKKLMRSSRIRVPIKRRFTLPTKRLIPRSQSFRITLLPIKNPWRASGS